MDDSVCTNPFVGTADRYAREYVPISVGFGMQIEQAINKAHRHCHIGRIVEKPKPS